MPTSCWTQPRERTTTSRTEDPSLKRLVSEHFFSHWRWFAIGGICALATSAAAVSYGFLIKLLGDRLQVAVAGEGGALGAWVWVFPAFIVAAAGVRALSLFAMTLANNTGLQRALHDLSNRQFAALVDGDYGRIAGEASGAFVSRFTNDLNTLRDFGLRLSNSAAKSLLTVLGAMLAMVWMDWQLALISLIAYPVAIMPVTALGNRVRKRAKRSQEQMGEVTAFLSESFQSARAVKAYRLETYQKQRADRSFGTRAKLYLKVLASKAGVDPILEVAGGIAIAGVLAFSAWRIVSGGSSIGDFLGFITLIAVAAPEVRGLGSLSASAQEARAAAERFYELVDAPRRVQDPAQPKPLERPLGAIEFHNVTFGYGDGAQVMNGVNLTVQNGETVALVGPSGAGKSTLFNLLLRLYDPDEGTITLGPHALQDLRLADLRGAISLVEQDPALFDDTVMANIALGDPTATSEQIEAAAKSVAATDFIAALPEGYRTPLGERGNRLSGGQRQRIALARAILRDAPILLLDEATSALDNETERAVTAALQAFAKDRTVLVIAHRLATVQWADRIVVMEAGRIVEDGTHDELLAAGGTYAELVKAGLG